uniref:Hdr-like menaquinol-oxidizing enzyme, subunit A (HmeA) n=1 Tax=uncultured sulfate-reducing bacterium TaxID=153939 RepID=Q3IBN2_9BACT|nr:Hdr-like menaquinol-oxidizing enzyme, subunit A (HmeA) [uncultured sulfate-reducing bacterium]
MGMDRRKFMKVAGVTALGVASGARSKMLARGTSRMTAGESPRTGTRWAMVIDLKKCAEADGCKDCINACHVTHNVPKFDSPKDEIKWIWKEPFERAFHSQENEYFGEELKHGPTLLLCNHCDNPPCVRVCPTQATWKREGDGIVMMDWHRCIGCRYCVAACPYGSRSFNWRDPRPHIADIDDDYPTRNRGVVEKCTFCEERLAKGQLPACVEACKAKAIVFGDLEDPDSEIRAILGERFTIRRKPELGTKPEVYYLV